MLDIKWRCEIIVVYLEIVIEKLEELIRCIYLID